MQTLTNKINEVLHLLFDEHPSLVIAGEDLLDPYGGAFKVTKGLSDRFAGRVVPFPISEAALAGWSVGRSMAGKPTIIEIMFSDFSSLAFDQLVNNASKLAYMYNDKVEVPLLIRLANGAGRGYGATHSQSMEKAFLGFPGLDIHIIDRFTPDLKEVYESFIFTKRPTLLFETKTDYPKRYEPNQNKNFGGDDGLLIATGTSASRVIEAADMLAKDGFEPRVEILHKINDPKAYEKLAVACSQYKFFVFVEDSYPYFGPYDYFCTQLVKQKASCAPYHLTGPSHAIPSSRELENQCFASSVEIQETFIKAFEKCF